LLGMVCGIAFLFKQHALVLIFGMFAWNGLSAFFLVSSWQKITRSTGLMILGFVLLPVVYVGLHLMTGGSLAALWYWVFGFVDAELAAMLTLFPQIAYLLAITPAVLAPVIYGIRWLLKFNIKAEEWWNEAKILVVLAASLTFAFPRFEPVHLQPFLALTAVISGQVLDQLLTSQAFPSFNRILQKGLAGLLAGIWVWGATTGTIPFLNFTTPQKIYEYSNLPALAGEIRQKIGEQDCIYILPEDEANGNLYYLLGCFPPRPWFFTSYPWYSRNGLAQQSLKAFINLNPKYVLYYPGRWQIESHNPDLVRYALDNYEKIFPLSFSEGEAWLMVRR
jgi:hypothetical protein